MLSAESRSLVLASTCYGVETYYSKGWGLTVDDCLSQDHYTQLNTCYSKFTHKGSAASALPSFWAHAQKEMTSIPVLHDMGIGPYRS